MIVISVIGDASSPLKRAFWLAGFSLVELLVVVAILTCMALAFPVALDRMLPGRRISATAEKLIINLRELQSRAVVAGRAARIQLSAGGYVVETPGSQRPAEMTLPHGMSLQLTSAADERAITQIVFFPDGSSTGGTLQLKEGGRRLTVRVSVITARIALSRPQ